MEARLIRTLLAAAALLFLAATYRTPNFVIEAPTADIAHEVGAYAEHYREALARAWLGKELPRWYRPCSLQVTVGNMGAGGSTTFSFDQGEVFGWRMVVQGTLDRILDSVLPHEVSHTIFACHFRRPLPRWADEGAATLAEDAAEQQRQTRMLVERLEDGRRYPLRRLFSMSEYPRDVLALYAQGFSVAKFLVQQKGEATYLACLGDALRSNWDKAVKQHYGFRDVEDLETQWLAWVKDGSPDVAPATPESIPLDRLPLAQRPKPNIIFRGQAPDERQSDLSEDVDASTKAGPISLASLPQSGWRPAGTRASTDEESARTAIATKQGELSKPVSLPFEPDRTRSIDREPAGDETESSDVRRKQDVASTERRQPLYQRIAMPRSKIPAKVGLDVSSRQIEQGISLVPARRLPARRLAIGPAYVAQPYSFAPT